MTTIDERVAAGAAWLDANRPGWWQRIDLDTLDLGDPCRCVLGQEYGQYHDAPHEIRIGSNPTGAYAAVEHGFNFNPFDPIDVQPLTAAWRNLIQARRADDYDTGAGWDRVADAMDLHGDTAALADPGLVEPAPLCGCHWGDGCGAGHTGYRPTVDADVKGELL